jgi:O-antigen ligase/tetratricopeptide (TPR) repeat protein
MKWRDFGVILVGMKDLSNILKNILPFVIMAVLISPFIIFSNLFFPYITGKAFFFRIVVEVAALLYMVLAVINRDYRPRWSPILWGGLVFTGVLILSTISAIDPLKAFWSNYERMEGLVLFLHLFAYLVIAGSVMKKKDGWWIWFFNFSLIMSVIIGVDAFLSFYSDPNHFGYRIFGNLGNSSYLGVYSLIHVFIAFFFMIKKIGHRSMKALADQGSFVSITFYALLAVFNLVVMFNTGTRGSFFGLVAGLFVTSLLLAIFERQNKVLRRVGIVFVGTLIAFVAFLGIFKESSFIKGSNMLSRFAELVTFDVKGVLENQGSARKMLWGMAWEGVKERPALGWGLDDFHYVFAAKYNPAMYSQEQWFDRSHNVFMDWMVSAGIIGLLSYLSLFALAIYMIWKISPERLPFALKSILIGGFVAYFGHNLFIFDNLSSYILFWSVLAFIHNEYISDKEARHIAQYGHAQAHGGHNKKDTEGKRAIILTSTIVLSLIVMSYICYEVNIKPWIANATLLDGLRPDVRDANGKIVQQTPEQKFAKVKEAYEMHVLSNSEPLEQLAEKGSELMTSNASADVKMQTLQYVMAAYEAGFKRTPRDPRPYYFFANFLSKAGVYDAAYQAINSALAISPNKQSFLAMKIALEIQTGKAKEAFDTALFAYNLEPRNEDIRKMYIAALILNGKADQAEAMATTTEDRIKYLTDGLILSTYADSKQQVRLIAMLKTEINAHPDNLELQSALINMYIRLGDKTSAIRQLNSLRSIEPSLGTQIDAMIKQIQEGK